MTLSGRSFALLAASGALFIAAFVTPFLGLLGLALDGFVLALAVADARRAGRLRFSYRREIPEVVHQGEPFELRLAIENPGPAPLGLVVREALTPLLLDLPLRMEATVPASARILRSATIVPRARGQGVLAPAAIRVRGPWGLAWAARLEAPAGGMVRVHPRLHFEGETGLELKLAMERRTGSHVLAARGLSTELYALREYLPGDDLRWIHWKTSARRNRPIVRETVWEQLQHVAVLLDCGRPMASRAGGYTKLDHALSAVVALLRVVHAREDEATLVLFSKEVRRIVRVGRRTRSFTDVFDRVYQEQADLDEPDYAAVAGWCARQLPRRSLALICTSVVELAGASRLGAALRSLASRHLPLLVNLVDPSLVGVAESVPDEPIGAFAKASAMAILAANRALEVRLAAYGIDVLSTSADRLAVGMVQRYLAVKTRARL